MNLLIETQPNGDFKVGNTHAREIQVLTERHKDLELDLMEADNKFDVEAAARIKREKLRIKDRIQLLNKHATTG